MPKTTLLIGGARSGKTHFAQGLALNSGKAVLFVATATAGDEEMRQRIEEHQKSRPAAWKTFEATTHIGNHILEEIGGAETVIIDCITLLLNNIFFQHSDSTGGQLDAPLIEKEVKAEIAELIECIGKIDADFIIVTNEIGLGLVPADRMSRLYRDLLGKANQMLAQHADEVYLMVAGIPLPIKPSRA